MRIDLLHPGPVRHRPDRCRQARTAYVPVVTRVELRELSGIDVGPEIVLEHTGRHRTVVRLVDGEPWRRIGEHWRPARRDMKGIVLTHPAVSAADFVSWLEGGMPHLDRTDVGRAFAGTPVTARPMDRMVLLRGREAWDAGRAGLILADHRGRAEAAVRRLFEADVGLVDGVPMARMRGPVANRSIEGWSLARYPGAPVMMPVMGDGVFYGLEQARRLPDPEWAAHARPNWFAHVVPGIRFRGDEDIALTLCEFAATLAWSATYPGREDGWGDGADWDEVRGRMFELAAAASAWLVADDDLPMMLDLLEGVAGRLSFPGRDKRFSQSALQLAYCRDYARPRLAMRKAEPGPDTDALAWLAPAP